MTHKHTHIHIHTHTHTHTHVHTHTHMYTHSLAHTHYVHHACRHPESIHRPTFSELQISLHQPDYMLLEWSEEDKSIYSENARTIGASYQAGESLYTDLQKTYEEHKNSD